MTQRFHLIWGTSLEVGLVQPADDSDGTKVLLAAVNTDHHDEGLSPTELRRYAEVMHLEPEEARMLARFLMQAADERDRVAA